MNENWPNFFIVGATRSGTTSLHEYLAIIPDIFMSKLKNPNFFGIYDKDTINDEKSYLELFNDVTTEKAIGESSGYLRNFDAAKKIYEKIPNAKIIISLRNPIERTYSHYLRSRLGGNESLTFSESFKKYMEPIDKESEFYNHYVKGSFYFEDVKRWMDLFGTNQVKIIIFEEFIKNPKQTIKQILDFLNVNSKIPDDVGDAKNPYAEPLGEFGDSIVKNKTIKKMAKSILPGKTGISVLRTILNKNAPKPEITPHERKILGMHLQDDVKKLKEVLGRDLPWKLN